MTNWLTIKKGNAPLLISLPHTGIDLAGLEGDYVSTWLARRDTDWWIDHLYEFAKHLDATIVHTSISRSVIDVNRDPSGISLYPGQTTTGLCPLETFDGDALYKEGRAPDLSEVERRRVAYHAPYHQALTDELARLRTMHDRVVLYDCHSIRSVLPRLFEGQLPVYNLGTNDGVSASPDLQALVEGVIASTGRSHVTNGRFKGGWITRSHGQPWEGVHALQMELANRGYMPEPDGKGEPANWPMGWDPRFAEPMRKTLDAILQVALAWARASSAVRQT